ncbi:biotin/lipoyl-containing protein [Streptococcus sp. S784/96/1]|uniref:biotin/lipoyl-containing protein n=1 Tax=Streptococcus sp. S784/96/1 TaxID=2653499 RepID=UPI001389B41E|nr:biotin/lipoyl-containing protein [Streptococcus sp. S784/96/1]
MKYEVTVNGQIYEVTLRELAEGETVATSSPAPKAEPSPAPVATTGDVLKAPMAGTVLAIKVQAGQAVKKGEVVAILEAMKMENEILASADATVSQVLVTPNQAVESDQALLAF